MCVFLVCPTSVFSLSIKPVHECLKRLVSVVRSYRGATVGQTAEKANAGSDKKSVRIQLFILLFAVLAAKGGPM